MGKRFNNRLTTDQPENNTDAFINMAFTNDQEVMIRNASEDGEHSASLNEVCFRECTLAGKNCNLAHEENFFVNTIKNETNEEVEETWHTSVVPGDTEFGLSADMPIEAFGEFMMGCAADGCPIAMMYFSVAGGAECRERLKAYEDEAGIDVTVGENIIREVRRRAQERNGHDQQNTD